jgi:sigma-E factor negative regulatory protein RseB
VTHWIAPGRRVAGLAAVLGLLGSGIAALSLPDTPPGPAGADGASLIDGAWRPARTQTAPGSAGIRLLRQAAAACLDTPYHGVQVVRWLGQGDPTTSVIDVWHQPGGVALVSPDGGTQQTGQRYPDLDGIMGVSSPLLELLAANYQVTYAGRGSAAGHDALVVDARHPGGGLTAQFWLDAATKLPLRREIFADDAGMVSEDAFTDLEVGDSSLAGMPPAASDSAPSPLTVSSLAALRAQGWPLPAQLPGSLTLFAATVTAPGSGQVVGMSYSDGLSVVSLFVQRGRLAGPMAGWRPVAVGGQTVYAVDPGDQGDRSLAWSTDGFVYTLVADAPAATVRQVVVAVPAVSPPGFWQRMGHGLHRLASWANPLHH